MKTLLMLRHAKSSWDQEHLSDHDRPLNKRGRQDAPQMGRLLAERDLLPQCVLCSTALRARTTAELVIEHAGFDGEIELQSDLYHAEPQAYIDVLREIADAAECVLVVGHNPGLEDLLEHLAGYAEHFPTAALAQIELPIGRWSELHLQTRGRLIQLWRPKDL